MDEYGPAWKVDYALHCSADTAMRQHDGTSTLWIDESLMNLYEILGFQPEGVNAL